MTSIPLPRPGFVLGLLLAAAVPAAADRPTFRVRTDFSVPVNSDLGWAAAPGTAAPVAADRPFRLRFEVGRPASAPAGSYRLQYRRNGGDWAGVEAHDFPYPTRELRQRFDSVAPGAPPPDWTFASAGGTAVVAGEGDRRVLRIEAGLTPLVAARTPPWPATSFRTRLRLPAPARSGLALLFGDLAAGPRVEVSVDPAAGILRAHHVGGDRPVLLAERPAAFPPAAWLDLEIKVEGRTLEVNLGPDVVEFEAALPAALTESQVGFRLPAGGAADFRDFELGGEPATPRVSLVSCPALSGTPATADLLAGSTRPFRPGAAASLAERLPAAAVPPGTDVHSEVEWPLVVRRFADGAATNEAGDRFDFRLVDAAGTPLAAAEASVRLAIPPGHLGGTFVETPGRIGPWAARNGDLYFVMEPAETHNVFMVVKSSDGGRTWHEVDAARRPRTGDLESVDGRQVGDTLHLLHQVTRTVRYHTFRTSDHPVYPDTWDIRDEVAARVDSIAQSATLVARSDASLVAFYVADTVRWNVRSPAGRWSEPQTLDAGQPPLSTGPKAVLGARDTVHLAYVGRDGTVWYRRLQPDGTLTPRERLASGLGTGRADYGAVLPLVYLPESDTVVVLYRHADGLLWERRIIAAGPPTPAVRATDRTVLQQAVDSQQPEADAVADGSAVHLLFVDEASRSLFAAARTGERWSDSRPLVEGIRGSWIRGNVYRRPDGATVYGYVCDAGSQGGAGMNRFGELVLRPAPAAPAAPRP